MSVRCLLSAPGSRRVLARLLARVLPLVVVAACAGVPSHGGQDVAPTPVDAAETFVHVRVPAPSKGLDARAVVDRFLAASAEFDEKFATARKYLTPAASDAWQPSAGITVVDRLAPAGTDRTASVQVLQGRIVGRVDAEGRYVERGVPQPVQVRVQLQRQGGARGDLRVSSVTAVPVGGGTGRAGSLQVALADGILLDQATVATVLAQLDLQWLNADSTQLIPEPLLLPRGTGDLAQLLVRRLAAGPSGWLAGTVRTAMPAGVQPQVTVHAGAATVALPGIASLSGPPRAALAAQVAATLLQSDLGVDQVTLAGSAAGGGDDITTAAAPFTPAPARLQQLLATDDAGRVWDVPPSARGARLPWVALSGSGFRHPTTTPGNVSPSASAALRTDRRGVPGLVVARAGRVARVVYRTASRSGLAPPSFDTTGVLWSADLARGVVLAVPRDARLRTVKVDLAAAARILGVGSVALTGVEPAPDGARLALVLTSGSDATRQDWTVVAPVVAGSGGELSLGTLQPLSPAATQGSRVLGVDWAQGDGPTVLLAKDNGTVVQQLLLGRVQPGATQPAGLASQIAVSGGASPIIVIGSRGPDGGTLQLSRVQQPPFRTGLRDPDFLR